MQFLKPSLLNSTRRLFTSANCHPPGNCQSGYCDDCINEVKAEEPGMTLAVARRRVGAKAKSTNTKASGKFGCTICKKHLCERHWEAHGSN